MSATADRLGEIVLDPGETWIEFGPAGARRRIAFHDYATLYGEPGLYERVFCERLGMCTADVVPGLLAEALGAAGLPAGDQRVLDLGAGSGLAGRTLRSLGVGHVVGLDLEPAARVAAGRDHPGAYDDYLVGDLGAWAADEVDALRRRRLTTLLAASAVGAGHVPAPTLRRALDVLAPGGLFAFAVTPALAAGSRDPAGRETGYPAFFEALFAGEAEELVRRTYVHRRQADGTPHDAVAIVGRLRSQAPGPP